MKKIVGFFIFSILALAYEVDNFTERYVELPDARKEMNIETNRRISLAIEKANKTTPPSCNSEIIENAVHNHLGSFIIGSMETYADSSDKIKNHKEPKESVYSLRSLSDKLKGGIMSIAGLNSSLNINGQYIGADKFGHFMDQGYSYLKTFKKNKKSYDENVKAALLSGIQMEESYYGLGATGVKSFGDLAANYGGFLFWIQLTEGSNPYFKCNEGIWKQVRSFDWADYVLPSWDEAINCSEFSSDGFSKAVDAQAKSLEKKYNKLGYSYKFVCPVAPKECEKMKKYYGERAPMILSPKCLQAVSMNETTYSNQNPSGLSGLDTEQKNTQENGAHR